MQNLTGIAALPSCIRILGSQTACARAIGISPQAVSEVVRRGRRVPAEWCRPLEAATAARGERVSAAELRPDLFAAALGVLTGRLNRAIDSGEADR